MEPVRRTKRGATFAGRTAAVGAADGPSSAITSLGSPVSIGACGVTGLSLQDKATVAAAAAIAAEELGVIRIRRASFSADAAQAEEIARLALTVDAVTSASSTPVAKAEPTMSAANAAACGGGSGDKEEDPPSKREPAPHSPLQRRKSMADFAEMVRARHASQYMGATVSDATDSLIFRNRQITDLLLVNDIPYTTLKFVKCKFSHLLKRENMVPPRAVKHWVFEGCEFTAGPKGARMTAFDFSNAQSLAFTECSMLGVNVAAWKGVGRLIIVSCAMGPTSLEAFNLLRSGVSSVDRWKWTIEETQ